MTDPTAAALVRRLCEEWHTLTRDDYRAIFTPEAVYVNMPRPTVERQGPDEAFEALSPWRSKCLIELKVLHIRGDDTVVMCERFEKFVRRSDGKTAQFHVLGSFEMSGGKISVWRDYYESAHSASALFLS